MPDLTLSYVQGNIEDWGVWNQYNAEVTQGGWGGRDLAIKQLANGVLHTPQRLHRDTNKSGSTNMDAPRGASIEACVVALDARGNMIDTPLSNVLTFTTP